MGKIIKHHGIAYRKFEHPRYKYRLASDYVFGDKRVPFASYKFSLETWRRYLCHVGHALLIKAGYAWDGPSGPTLDTPSFMRGSLVHDVLYQLMRERQIPRSFRRDADQILVDICKQDGMSWIRRRWVYAAVRLFGGKFAKPRN